MVVRAVDIPVFLDCDMCLGEGTGAMAALGLIDMAVYTYKHTITFRELDIEAYVHFKL